MNRIDSCQVVLVKGTLGGIHHMSKGIVMREEQTGILRENTYNLVCWSSKYEVVAANGIGKGK